MSDSTDPVTCVVDEGVAVLTLNRPQRRNAWTLGMEEAYFGLLDTAGADPDVRAIVVTGAGESFCPGLDMSVLDDIRGGAAYSPNRRPQTHAVTVPKPIIAAINGNCAGVGLLQALLCDIRFAVRGARFSTAFARRGLPAEDASSWLLPRLVGVGRAMDLLVSGRVFEAEAALNYGVVQQLCEPGTTLDVAFDYARDLARHSSPVAMAMIKHQIWADLESSMDQSRIRSQYLLPIAKRQPDFQEGVASFVERRPPQFEPYRPINY